MNLYDFFLENTIYCIIFLQLFIILSLVLLIVSIIFLLKNKKRYWIVPLIFSLFGVYQAVPHYFEVKAATALDDEGVVKNYEMAIKTAVLPMHKGMLYAGLASYYGSKNLPLSLKYYEKTFKYTKNYESYNIWLTASLTYYLNGDFDKVIEIADVLKNCNLLKSEAYIMKGDFNNALSVVNIELEKNSNSWYALALRANILRNLNKEKEALLDYNRALKLCKYENQYNTIKQYFKNKQAIKNEWNKKRAAFKEKGGIL